LRDVSQAERQLHDLRVQEWGDLGLGGVAIALSLVATQLAHALVLPLFIGGIVVVILGGRASVRRWDLCERLVTDPGAYVISEIGARAETAANPAGRAALAASVRKMLAPAPEFRRQRVQLVAGELAKLADELEDEHLALDPLCAVRCKRLLTDPVESPLLNSFVPADGLRVAIVVIRHGFVPRLRTEGKE
jgi:hypothetical protein